MNAPFSIFVNDTAFIAVNIPQTILADDAHQITRAELRHYDHIYYMDASNARWLRRLFGPEAEKCRPLLDRDVADPWYTGDFSQTWNAITQGCERILEELC